MILLLNIIGGIIGASTWIVISIYKFVKRNKPMAVFKKITPMSKVEQKHDNGDEKSPQISYADFHVNLRFNDEFSSSISFFKKEKIVKRRIRAISEASHGLMLSKGMAYYDLPNLINFDCALVDAAVEDTENLGSKFIEQLIAQKIESKNLQQHVPQVVHTPQVVHASQAVQTPQVVHAPQAVHTPQLTQVPQPRLEPTPMVQRNSLPAEPVAMQKLQANRQTETTTVGRVAEMGMRKMLFGSANNKREGETFETAIELRDGGFVSHRGVRLQEIFRENQIRVGDHVEIRSLGKSQVKIGDSNSLRNEYSVKVLERM